MKETNKYWFEVLSHFEREKYFVNGLTIPFLIGSRSIIEPEREIQSISDLITDLINFPKSTSIMKCGNIKEFVIGILDFETNLLIRNQYQGIHKQFGNLVITDNSFHNIQRIDKLILYFEDLYTNILNQKLFSKENGAWIYYNDSDKLRLNEILQIE